MGLCECVCVAWWFDWQWWIRMWVCYVCIFCLVGLLCVCVFGLVGLLVVAMMEVLFIYLFLLWFVVVGGCGGCGVDAAVDVEVFFFLFFCGGCGMGGGFCGDFW